MGQKEGILGEDLGNKLPNYSPKGTHIFPVILVSIPLETLFLNVKPPENSISLMRVIVFVPFFGWTRPSAC